MLSVVCIVVSSTSHIYNKMQHVVTRHAINPTTHLCATLLWTKDNAILIFTASELLREAEKLIEQKIHPQTIIGGWRKAVDVARAALEEASSDNSASADRFREDLLNIARTTLSSKILSQHKEHFSRLAVEAVLRLKGSGDLQVGIQRLILLFYTWENSFTVNC